MQLKSQPQQYFDKVRYTESDTSVMDNLSTLGTSHPTPYVCEQ